MCVCIMRTHTRASHPGTYVCIRKEIALISGSISIQDGLFTVLAIVMAITIAVVVLVHLRTRRGNKTENDDDAKFDGHP